MAGILYKYAPLWSIVLGTLSTLTKTMGNKLILEKELKISPQDVLGAIGGALAGYVFFRLRYGYKNKSHPLKR